MKERSPFLFSSRPFVFPFKFYFSLSSLLPLYAHGALHRRRSPGGQGGSPEWGVVMCVVCALYTSVPDSPR